MLSRLSVRGAMHERATAGGTVCEWDRAAELREPGAHGSMANLLMYSRGQEGFAPNQWRDLHSFPLECAPSTLCFRENIHLCFARLSNFPQHLTTKQEEQIWGKKINKSERRSEVLPFYHFFFTCLQQEVSRGHLRCDVYQL